MKYSIFCFLALLFSNKLLAQSKSYSFIPERTKEILDPYAKGGYEVNNASYTTATIPIYDSIEKKNFTYIFLEKDIKDKVADSIQYAKKLNFYEKSQSIIEYIDLFINSNLSYKKKSIYLIEAQKKAMEMSLNYLIYADKDLNSDNRKKFSSIRKNSLVIHLQNIKIDISRENYFKTNAKIFTELKEMREELKDIKEFKKYKEKIGSREIKVLVAENKINDYEKISGNFVDKGKYILINKSGDEYTVNQLVHIDSLKLENEEKIMNEYGSIYTLLENVQKNYLFYCDSNFLYDFGFDQELLENSKLYNENGFPTFFEGKILYIKKNNQKLKVTQDIIVNVRNSNFNYINQMLSSVRTFKELITQAEPLIEKLSNHFSAHQNFTMTDKRLALWKNDTQKGINIMKKIQNLKGNEPDVNNYFLEKIDAITTNKYIEFLEVLNGTKIVLGM